MSYKELLDLIANKLEMGSDELNPTQSLIEQGLDSMRMIAVLEQLRDYGLEPDFFTLASAPTAKEWADALGISA